MPLIVPVEDDVTASNIDICFFDCKVPEVTKFLKSSMSEF